MISVRAHVHKTARMRAGDGFKFHEPALKWPVVFLTLMTFPHFAIAAQENATIVNLTQTGCQFVEPESIDHKYETSKPDDCKAVNKLSGERRLAKHQVLHLKPGRYIFRVENVNVPYELGFYLRAENRAVIPFSSRVSGAGLFMGNSKDYAVELDKGIYLYSCPYNPTPNYRLVVSE